MPRAARAYVAQVERWLQDHDSDIVDEQPPVQNTWYEAFHAEDVRLLWCVIQQDNDEVAVKDLQVLWTIDGNVYRAFWSAASGTLYYIFRGYAASAVGTDGLTEGTDQQSGAYRTDKRGLDFKVEGRITSVVGTNQRLRMWCVRETHEIT